jgi:hypothetical protein
MTHASFSCLDIGPWLVKIKRIVVVAASNLNLASQTAKGLQASCWASHQEQAMEPDEAVRRCTASRIGVVA